MSTQILGTVGQAVGTVVGGPIGGFIGGQLGARIGTQVGGTKRTHYEGARLEELAVQTSTYGRAVPRVWGSVRLAGNVIWARPIREMRTTTTVTTGGGGKGGGGGAKKTKTTQTEYSYSVTLAIAICAGQLTRIDRVWADAKLLDLSQGTYRLYRGTESQMPDPLIESYHGVGRTPAYRGLAYVVIEDFPLGDFGNRIPNFSFEVTRRAPQRDHGDLPAESLVRSVMMIPGSGEFVYDTLPHSKQGGEDAYGTWVQTGFETSLNRHTAEGKANVLVALDQMQQALPNLEWVGVAVNWFGTSMDIAHCDIWPCVEYQVKATTTPSAWGVAGLNRATARQVGNDGGQLRYGGTPDDASLQRLCAEMRARGLKVFLYPMLLMDLPGKPWRGEMTGAAAAVPDFFTKARGYNRFILHYANLLRGYVDAFAIGSELRDLTAISPSAGVFPAVPQLVALAGQVKSILGTAVKVTYAADWSEYHHTTDGWHHLDPLWASGAIDMVGIDAYFPLTDGERTRYDIHAIREGWRSGEGYDWYYTDPARTVKAPLAPDMAWKNVEYWWKHPHTNPNGAATAWVPQSKPLWFTEYGFASVDGCTNQPNVFVDAGTSGGSYPRFSRGRVDFMAQRTAIAATEAEWGSNAVVARRFLWTWDARPYPYWPDLRSVWADGASWVSGHWVQGKLGSSHVSGVVEEIAAMAGCDVGMLDTSRLQMVLDGFVLSERTSARAAIEQLMKAYFFTMRESGGKLVALPRHADTVATIDASACLPLADGAREVAYRMERAEDLLLPDVVEVHSLNRLQRYGTHVQAARRGTHDANEVATLRVGLVLSQAHGQAVAETMLADRWAERSQLSLQLPVKYAALEAGDVIALADGAMTHRVRLLQVQYGRPGMVRVQGVLDASDMWDGYVPPTLGGAAEELEAPAPTRLLVLDMPALPGDAPDALAVRLAACGQGRNWDGATLLRTGMPGEEQWLADITAPATMGASLTVLPNGPDARLDHGGQVDVALLGEAALGSIDMAALLAGHNLAMLGDELLCFGQAELLEPGKYRLRQLMRGLHGTEWAMGQHVAGERFVLLNGAVQALVLPLQALGQDWTIRAVTAGTPLSGGPEYHGRLEGRSLKPLAPVRVEAVRDAGSGDVTFRWLRRTRIDGGLRDYVEIPLMEQEERYLLRVMDGEVEKRRWQPGTPEQLYPAAEQLADFGGLAGSYRIELAQLSAWVGPGNWCREMIEVR